MRKWALLIGVVALLLLRGDAAALLIREADDPEVVKRSFQMARVVLTGEVVDIDTSYCVGKKLPPCTMYYLQVKEVFKNETDRPLRFGDLFGFASTGGYMEDGGFMWDEHRATLILGDVVQVHAMDLVDPYLSQFDEPEPEPPLFASEGSVRDVDGKLWAFKRHAGKLPKGRPVADPRRWRELGPDNDRFIKNPSVLQKKKEWDAAREAGMAERRRLGIPPRAPLPGGGCVKCEEK